MSQRSLSAAAADDEPSNSFDSSSHELPSLEDRKIFLTCLACLLVSSYQYDVQEKPPPSPKGDASAPQLETTVEEGAEELKVDAQEETNGENGVPNVTAEENLRGDVASDEDDNSDNSDDDDEDLLDSAGSKLEISMFMEDYEEEVLGAVDVSMEEVDDEDDTNGNDEEEGDGKEGTERKLGRGQRWRQRFGRGRNNKDKNTDSSTSGTNGSTSESDMTPQSKKKNNKKQLSLRSSEKRERRKRVSKAQKKLQLASKRHYHRRFVVAEQLLQTSVEYLMVDETQEERTGVFTELAPRLEVLKAPRIIPYVAATEKTLEMPGSNGTTPTSSPAKKGLRQRWSSLGKGRDSNVSNTSSEDLTATDTPNGDTTAATESNSEKGAQQEAVTTETSNDGNSNNHSNPKDPQQTPQKQAQEDPRIAQLRQQYLTQKEWMTEYDTNLAEHISGLSPGAGYRCLCWLLFQHLINANKRGYDARVRYMFKLLAVAVLVQDIERTLDYDPSVAVEDGKDAYTEWKAKNYTTWVSFATRKFDQMEAGMSDRLLKLAQQSMNESSQNAASMHHSEVDDGVNLEDLEAEEEDDIQVVTVKKNKKKLVGARKHLVRGLKIGGVGVVAGTLLAVTGGMAAPAIAGALTFLGMGAVAGTFLTLASTTAVVHIFGVAGGSLAAYKMRRRTAGLTEFTIVQSTATTMQQPGEPVDDLDDDLLPGEKEQQKANQPRLARWKDKAKAFKERRQKERGTHEGDGPPPKAELSRTICISGWLTDKCDFQRPWGITPSKPPPTKLEKLQRFYRVYNPDLIPVCDNLLKRWKKEMSTFWELLEDKYGCNPDTLFPLQFGPMHDAKLTDTELLVLDRLIIEVGEARSRQKEAQHAHLPKHVQSAIAATPSADTNSLDHSRALGTGDDESVVTEEGAEKEEELPRRFQRQCYASVFEQVAPSSSLEKLIPPAHLATVWDYSSRYGGEVYSLHWETHMLTKLCLCFRDVALTSAASAGQQALRLMVANTIAMAASVPIYVLQAMNSIDETWSVVVSRAEDAGKELARSLMVNNAGHRPVTLVGYSFGARVVFSCLKQLAVYQQQWEDYHEQKASRAIGFAAHEEANKAKRKEKKWMLHELEFDREPASVVEDAIIMGAPMYLSLASWKACRQVVAGRFVNVYSRTDKILSLMFKYKQMMEAFKPVCGNCTIAVPGVENIDISDLVSNHQEYVLKLGDILKRVRHEQPIRSSTVALDEVALIAEANLLVKEKEATEEVALETSPAAPAAN